MKNALRLPPGTPADIAAVVKAGMDFGWFEETADITTFLYGINVALRHPEWAQAVEQKFLRFASTFSDDLAAERVNKTVAEFVASAPMRATS